MTPYVADAFASVRIAELHREADVRRLAARLPRPPRPRTWSTLVQRFAAWAERPRAGRSLGVCCPA